MLGQHSIGLLPIGIGDESNLDLFAGNAVIEVNATGDLDTYVQKVAAEGNAVIDISASGTLTTRLEYLVLPGGNATISVTASGSLAVRDALAENFKTDVLKSELPAYIELFEFDFSTAGIPGLSGYFRCTPIKHGDAYVLFGEDQFICNFPIEITGIEQTSGTAPARPQITITNVDKYFGSLAFTYRDLAKTTVIYYRTFATYLNLPSRFAAQPLKFEIAKKLFHNKKTISFELRDPTDKERSYMPGRQMLRADFPGLGTNKRVS